MTIRELQTIEEPMTKIPQTDSVEELARFWDAHDLTKFEEELEEVNAPVFERDGEGVLRVALPPDEAAALRRAAQARGVNDVELVREWLREKLQAS